MRIKARIKSFSPVDSVVHHMSFVELFVFILPEFLRQPRGQLRG
jgi:hypothetical protein